MHNLTLEKFIKERGKLDDKEFNISDIYLYELIFGNNINDSQKITGFFLNLILNLFSAITILKCKILKVRKLNYVITNKNSPTRLDFRSEKIIANVDLHSCINLIRNKDFFSSIIVYFKYPNVIFYSGIESIFIYYC